MIKKKRIAVLGGGPSGLFMFKRLVESGRENIHISIFERKSELGSGMPYSKEGANNEHITNVSSNEIPEIVTSISEWIKTVPEETLEKFKIDPKQFNEYKVLPRLLFGNYLNAQFSLLQKQAKEKNIDFKIYYNSEVTDVCDISNEMNVIVEINTTTKHEFDHVIFCTGHNWPHRHEGKISGYYDSPYPPSKLELKLNHQVAIKGSSLTAVDAIRTLARKNGIFSRNKYGELMYDRIEESLEFKLVLHTRNGMLPAVRFHLDDSHLSNSSLLSNLEIQEHIYANEGFLSLDWIFENNFKNPIRHRDPAFYDKIKDMNMEEFVDAMMDLRERLDPFDLLKAEYSEAERSIRRRKSIYWKEMLGVLSFALNYPAKHLSAEDMQRLQGSLGPLISIVIAYIPQGSSEELLAMHRAGALSLISVGEDSEVKAEESGGATYAYTTDSGEKMSVYYNTYIDCVGQPKIEIEDFPFKGLSDGNTVVPAKLKFRSVAEAEKAIEKGRKVVKDLHDNYYLRVSGIAINDHFQVVDEYGAYNERLYVMAVPYIGGYNPDYSGLDFSEAASAVIVKRLFN